MAYNIKQIQENISQKKDDNTTENLDEETYNVHEFDNDILDDFSFYIQYKNISDKINENISNLLKNPYILYIFLMFMDYLNIGFDNLLLLKLNLQKKYNDIVKHHFNDDKILNIYLIDEYSFKEINHYNLKNITNEIYDELFNDNNMQLNSKSCMLIRYKINNIVHRLYIHNTQISKNFNFPDDIQNMENFNKEYYEKEVLHFFNNECNIIKSAYLNDLDIKELIIECNGPYFDFGLMNNNVIIIKNIMQELNINNLFKFEVNYVNFHLDEDKMELLEHKINIKDENEYINSNIIDKFIKKSN